MGEENRIAEEAEAPSHKIGIFTILAGVGLLVCCFTPRITLSTPVLATMILGGIGFYRHEQPRWLPAALGALALVILLSMEGAFTIPNSISANTKSWKYGSDQTYGDWAKIYTDTDLKLASPYDGDNAAYLQVDSSGGVLIVVEKGQIVFPYEHCVVQVNDYSYPCSTPQGFGDDHLAILPASIDARAASQPANPAKLIRALDEVTITLQFYDNGYRNLHFNTKGLKLALDDKDGLEPLRSSQ